MKNKLAVGGLGGSGTRLVAEILIKIGYFLGSELNESYDNLIFSALFKDPEFYKTATNSEFIDRINIFYKHLTLKKLSFTEAYRLNKIINSNNLVDLNTSVLKILFKRPFITKFNQSYIGWKEPNTHFYIDSFLNHDQNLKYIHVIRNGLDMAFSKNTQQLKNWGCLYKLDNHPHNSIEELAKKQLDMWIHTTKNILNVKKKFSDRVMFLNYDQLCLNPKISINKMIEFLNIDVDLPTFNEISTLPQIQESIKRYRSYNLKIFDESKINFVARIGFDVN